MRLPILPGVRSALADHPVEEYVPISQEALQSEALERERFSAAVP